jgi:hypothetical protein
MHVETCIRPSSTNRVGPRRRGYAAGVAVVLYATVSATIGCAGMASVFQPAELSENYALLPGVIAQYKWQDQVTPAPDLVDGSPETRVGTSREVHVILPERRSIRRVVARNANYEDATLYVGGRGADEWRMVGQIKQNTEPDITFKVNAVTDRIRIRIGGTSDDKHGTAPRVVGYEDGIPRTSTFTPGKPTAGEIEIYGYRPRTEDP